MAFQRVSRLVLPNSELLEVIDVDSSLLFNFNQRVVEKLNLLV
jgi:hypothetical protein